MSKFICRCSHAMKFHKEFSSEEFKIIPLESIYNISEMLDKKEMSGDSFLVK